MARSKMRQMAVASHLFLWYVDQDARREDVPILRLENGVALTRVDCCNDRHFDSRDRIGMPGAYIDYAPWCRRRMFDPKDAWRMER